MGNEDKSGHERARQPHHTIQDRITVAEAGLTHDEVSVLTILRLFCTTYANPESQAWENGFDCALSSFGPNHGPLLGPAIMNVMRSLRCTRKSNFRFTNPGCPCCRATLSDHELHMMRLLKAERRGDGPTRQTCAVILCEGEDPGLFLASISELAGRLNAFAPQTPSARKNSKSRRLNFFYR